MEETQIEFLKELTYEELVELHIKLARVYDELDEICTMFEFNVEHLNDSRNFFNKLLYNVSEELDNREFKDLISGQNLVSY